ncbi:hypothetical protein TrVE_jg6521 [Triparma verrucosa]|uniref:RING-type domain-containing protein n=1 Tax=Triparma verrucosa TaxID=1606542 RepID=A0A9W7FGJ4_9STRA|nr:hypothetical protein TrVE_jg6521 [Triparma verrucosa]
MKLRLHLVLLLFATIILVSAANRLSRQSHRTFAKGWIGRSPPCEEEHWDGRLCDPSHQVDSDALSTKLQQSNLKKVTICSPNLNSDEPSDSVEIAIVLLPNFKHIPKQSFPDADSEDGDRFITLAAKVLAEELHDHYGVGDPRPPSCSGEEGFDTGILILVSRDERVMHISTGSGVTDFFAMGRIDLIIKAAKPHFRMNQLGQGLIASLERLDEFLDMGPPTRREKLLDSFITFGPFFVIFGFFCAILYQSHKKAQQYNAAKEELNKLEREKAEALAGKYRCKSCPICLEDFKYVPPPPVINTVNENTEGGEGDGGVLPPPPAAPQQTLDSNNEPVKLLRCGHCFDQKCFMEYQKSSASSNKCPICRADIGTGAPADTSGSNSSNTTSNPFRRPRSQNRTRGGFYEDSYEPELRFRLNRLRHRYPRYISSGYVDRYSTKSAQNFAMDPVFMRSNPNPPASRARSSGFSSSTRRSGGGSFGGGRSSGGGGGGRW